ncbi:MAG: hypothetical protein AAF224_09520 [Pseudomonadota bacterium]
MQGEIIGLLSLLEKFGYDPKDAREDFCDALTGGNFDSDGTRDENAAALLSAKCIDLRVSIDDFAIQTIKRPLIRLLLAPLRVLMRMLKSIFDWLVEL